MTLAIDACAAGLADFVAESSPQIRGPHETAYGAHWAPTISYWIGHRRVHLYEDWCIPAPHAFALEVADLGIVRQRCHVTTIAEIREIIELVLCRGVELNGLPAHERTQDTTDADKFIPDPPNVNNVGNIAAAVGKHIVPLEQSILGASQQH